MECGGMSPPIAVPLPEEGEVWPFGSVRFLKWWRLECSMLELETWEWRRATAALLLVLPSADACRRMVSGIWGLILGRVCVGLKSQFSSLDRVEWVRFWESWAGSWLDGGLLNLGWGFGIGSWWGLGYWVIGLG